MGKLLHGAHLGRRALRGKLVASTAGRTEDRSGADQRPGLGPSWPGLRGSATPASGQCKAGGRSCGRAASAASIVITGI